MGALSNPQESVYHWNEGYSYDYTIPPGDDWTFDVRLNLPEGEHAFSWPLRLVPSGPQEWSSPYSCTVWEEPSWGWSSRYWSAWTTRIHSISGYDEG